MYFAVVTLTTLVLPILSILLDDGALLPLIAKWFVFWGIGARLLLAGIRQVATPDFTARDIFALAEPGARVLVRELGAANIGMGMVGVASFAVPEWLGAAALAGGLFMLAAGIEHVQQAARTREETVAMVSDLWIAGIAALSLFAVLTGRA